MWQEHFAMTKQCTPTYRPVKHLLLDIFTHNHNTTILSDGKIKAWIQSKGSSSWITVPLDSRSSVKKFIHEQKVNMVLLNIGCPGTLDPICLTEHAFVLFNWIFWRKFVCVIKQKSVCVLQSRDEPPSLPRGTCHAANGTNGGALACSCRFHSVLSTLIWAPLLWELLWLLRVLKASSLCIYECVMLHDVKLMIKVMCFF